MNERIKELAEQCWDRRLDGVHFDQEKFAALVAAHEREECAKVCEEQMKAYMSSQYTTDPLGGFRERFAAERCAAAIRVRGEK